MEEKVPGVVKASILLLSLSEDVAAKVLKNLDSEAVRKVTRCMADLKIVPKSKVKEVLMDAKSALDDLGAVGKGMESVKRLLVKALGEEKGEEVLHLLEDASGVSTGLGHEEVEFDGKVLATLLRDEHPQIVALILSLFPPERSREVIMELPDELRVDVIYRLSRMENVSPDVVREVRENLRRKVFGIGAGESRKQGGFEKVMEIVKGMEKGSVDELLEKLKDVDSELADRIEKNLFTFDDFINLSDRDIQALMREIDSKTLVLALKAASDSLRDLFLRNMSQRAREMLLEDIEAMGPVKLRDVEAAQQKIVEVARRLEEEGKIVLQKGGEGEIVV